jgi:hypothetical protein
MIAGMTIEMKMPITEICSKTLDKTMYIRAEERIETTVTTRALFTVPSFVDNLRIIGFLPV